MLKNVCIRGAAHDPGGCWDWEVLYYCQSGATETQGLEFHNNCIIFVFN